MSSKVSHFTSCDRFLHQLQSYEKNPYQCSSYVRVPSLREFCQRAAWQTGTLLDSSALLGPSKLVASLKVVRGLWLLGMVPILPHAQL